MRGLRRAARCRCAGKSVTDRAPSSHHDTTTCRLASPYSACSTPLVMTRKNVRSGPTSISRDHRSGAKWHRSRNSATFPTWSKPHSQSRCVNAGLSIVRVILAPSSAPRDSGTSRRVDILKHLASKVIKIIEELRRSVYQTCIRFPGAPIRSASDFRARRTRQPFAEDIDHPPVRRRDLLNSSTSTRQYPPAAYDRTMMVTEIRRKTDPAVYRSMLC